MKFERLSQEAVAQALGVSQGLVSGWCRGKYKPDIHQGLALAKLLKLSLDYLVDESVPALAPDQVDRDREVRSILVGIGIEEAWRRLVGIDRPS